MLFSKRKRPPPAAGGRPAPSSASHQRSVPRGNAFLVFLSTLVASACFTPFLVYYRIQRGKTNRLAFLAIFLENAIVYTLFLDFLLRRSRSSTSTSSSSTTTITHTHTRRHHLTTLLLLLSFIFLHSFFIAAQITAIALMGTKMNSDFIWNIVHAIKTDTWAETEAKYFFPSMISANMACELACLLVGWKYRQWQQQRQQAFVKDKEDDALGGGRRGIPPVVATAAAAAAAAAASPQTISKRQWLTLSTLLLFRTFFLRRAYSPLANTFYSIASYTQMENIKKFRPHPQQAHYDRYNKHNPYTYNYTHTSHQSKSKKKTNVVYVLNDSLGNGLLHTEEGLKAFPYYTHVVQQHPNFYDFRNVRANSASTDTASSAAFTGYYVAAPDFHPDTWSYFHLPSLFTLGKARGYRLVLFCPFDTDDWWPLDQIFDDKFDKIVSRSQLNGKVANDMGMDDRIITEKILEFLDEEGAKFNDKDISEEERQPFILVIFWNNMHAPFLENKEYRADDPSFFAKHEEKARKALEVGLEEAAEEEAAEEEERKKEKEKEKEGGGDGEGEGTEEGEEEEEERDAQHASSTTRKTQAAATTGAAATATAAAAGESSPPEPKVNKLMPSSTSRNFAQTAKKVHRCMGSLALSNEMVQQVHDKLQETGLLRETIVTFQADHGEGVGDVQKRIGNPDSRYLSTPFWMHVPSYLLPSEKDREVLRGNSPRLVSNRDMMPTLVEILGWETTEHLFEGIPSIFKHGRSLLRPVPTDRLVSGWQGRPFVDSCEWMFMFLSNATHTLILRTEENDIVVEELEMYEDATRSLVKQRQKLGDLPAVEQEFWTNVIKANYSENLEAFRECYWDYI